MQNKVYTVDEIKRKLEQYCVYQDRCHKEVEQKLKEFSLIPEAKEVILLSLRKYNFLSEKRFARGKILIAFFLLVIRFSNCSHIVINLLKSD